MRAATSPAVAPRVLVVRSADQAGDLVDALRRSGLRPVAVPAIAVDLDADRARLEAIVRRRSRDDWVVVTSVNGARAALDAFARTGSELVGVRWAAVGPATRALLAAHGLDVAFMPAEASGRSLGSGLPISPGDRILLVRGDLADDRLPASLRLRGATVEDVVGYRTRIGPAGSARVLRDAFADGPLAAVILTSGSTARGLLALAGDNRAWITALPVVCIGPESARAAARLGFTILAVAESTDPDSIAAATVAALAATITTPEIP